MHIFLPGVDDGPKTIEESIQLIRTSHSEGITDIIATPHAYSPHFDVSERASSRKTRSCWTNALKEKVSQ